MFYYDFKVPENKIWRVMIHTDCKLEADDQYAVVHHLLTPKYEVTGIVASHFNDSAIGKPMEEIGQMIRKIHADINPLETALASRDEVLKILRLMGIEGSVPVAAGAPVPLKNESEAVWSEGAQLIIDEALKEDSRPLFLCCQAPLTDVASALLLRPEIAEKMTIIWVGGGSYPAGGYEYNLLADIKAANVVFSSQVPLWQIPVGTYKQIGVTLAELQYHVKPCGAIGRYLFEQMAEFNEKAKIFPLFPHGESWGLGDSAPVGVLLQELEKEDFILVHAPHIRPDMTYKERIDSRKIRVYHRVDSRMILGDFFAKLAIQFGKNG